MGLPFLDNFWTQLIFQSVGVDVEWFIIIWIGIETITCQNCFHFYMQRLVLYRHYKRRVCFPLALMKVLTHVAKENDKIFPLQQMTILELHFGIIHLKYCFHLFLHWFDAIWSLPLSKKISFLDIPMTLKGITFHLVFCQSFKDSFRSLGISMIYGCAWLVDSLTPIERCWYHYIYTVLSIDCT